VSAVSLTTRGCADSRGPGDVAPRLGQQDAEPRGPGLDRRNVRVRGRDADCDDGSACVRGSVRV
jgi:hypothetical protein